MRTRFAKSSSQIRFLRTYMRGGTSKGVFFRLCRISQSCQVPGAARDKLFMRVIGSPDPYSAHIDGMAAPRRAPANASICRSGRPITTSSTSMARCRSTSLRRSGGNCGNLSTGAGAFALHAGLVDASHYPGQRHLRSADLASNIGKTIIAHVPVANGQVQETGDFEAGRCDFSAAEIVLEFLDPSDDGGEGGSMFPTGNLVDDLGARYRHAQGNHDQCGHPDSICQCRDIGYQGTVA